MVKLSGAVGELKMILQIKRKDSDKVEEVTITGFLDEEQAKIFQKEVNHGSDTQHSGA